MSSSLSRICIVGLQMWMSSGGRPGWRGVTGSRGVGRSSAGGGASAW
jgi:hypothetical protein